MLEQRHGAFEHLRVYRMDIPSRLQHFVNALEVEPLRHIASWAKASN